MGRLNMEPVEPFFPPDQMRTHFERSLRVADLAARPGGGRDHLAKTVTPPPRRILQHHGRGLGGRLTPEQTKAWAQERGRKLGGPKAGG